MGLTDTGRVSVCGVKLWRDLKQYPNIQMLKRNCKEIISFMKYKDMSKFYVLKIVSEYCNYVYYFH